MEPHSKKPSIRHEENQQQNNHDQGCSQYKRTQKDSVNCHTKKANMSYSLSKITTKNAKIATKLPRLTQKIATLQQ